MLSQLLAVLRAELVRAVDALQRGIAVIPKALGVEQRAGFPKQEDRHGHQQQAAGKEAVDKEQGGEHHEMVPIEDTAGCATAIAHHQAERAPNQYADQVADVEDDRAKEERGIAEHGFVMQPAKQRGQHRPKQEDAAGGAGGADDVGFERLAVDLFQDGTKMLLKELQGADGKILLNRKNLREHIEHPDPPEQMQK